MRTRRDKQMRYAKEQSKRHGGIWVVEEVVGGYGKDRIQANLKGENCWWDSSIVRVLATYKNGIRT